MEETTQEIKENKFLNFLKKYQVYILIALIILLVGLSMIGPFFELRLKANGEKIDTDYNLAQLLFTNQGSTSIQLFFIFIYLALPLFACLSLILGKFHQNFYVIAVLLFLLCAISSIVSQNIFANYMINTYDGDYSIHHVYVSFVLPIVTFFVASILCLVAGSYKTSISIYDITEMGLLIGLALVLNFIKFVQLGETGGSINFQMLPLFILALRKGPLKGFIGAGIAYGLISCLTDGYGIATYPFDYLLGMGSVCILGFFSPFIFGEKQNTYNIKGEVFLLIGGLLSTFFRFVGGCASSMIIYSYQLVPAMIYNVVYVFASGGVAIAVLMMVYGPFIRINKRFPSNRNKSSI